MRLKVFSISILLQLLAISLMAQVLIKGQVIDKEKEVPIPNAEVFIKESSYLLRTNSKGNFQYTISNPIDVTIVVFVAGYNVSETLIRKEQLRQSYSLNILLEPFSQELSEVTITQKREESFNINRLNPVEGTAIYAGKKSEVVLLEQMTGNLSANNARQIYSQVVGLNIYENNDAGLQLNIGGRGLDPNRTSNFNTRQNGYDISADVLGYPESYYTPPAEALEEIQVVRGAASLQYGTQFGGLLNFQFKEPNPVKKISWTSRQSIGSYGLFTSFNSLSGTVNKFSYYTYFNFKTGNGFRPNSNFDSYNFYAGLNYSFNDKTRISFEATYLYYLAKQPGGMTDTQFEEDYTFSNRERNWFEVDWRLAALKLEHKFSVNTDLTVNLFTLDAKRNALGFRGDPKRPERNPITEPDDPTEFTRDLIKGTFNNWGAEARLLTRYSLNSKNAVFLIGSKYYQSNNTSIQGPGTNAFDADFSFRFDEFSDYPNQSDFVFPNLNLALFAENIFFINPKFSITPGIRYEYIKTESEGEYLIVRYDNAGNEIFRKDTTDNRRLERSFVLLGLGGSFTPNESLEVYGNISQNYRSVTFSDIRVVNPTFIIDPNIQDERGFTADLGIRGKIKSSFSYDASLFLLSYQDRIGTILASAGPNKGDRIRKNIGDAVIAGLELFGDWNIVNSFKFNREKLKLNLFANLALTNSEYTNSEENNVVGKKVEFIPDYNLKTGINGGLGNFLLSIQYTHLAQQYTDAQNTPIPESGDSREGIIGEIPSYSIMDLSLSYRYKFLRFETGVNNLLNEEYFTRRATGYPGPGIIPSDPRTYYLTLEIKL